MIINLHTHTFRCHHATGTEREYIENAIKSGIKTLGFSDHIPCPFKDGHESNYRIYKDEIEFYFSKLHELRKEYADKIEIFIGFESEYYPAYFDKMLEFVQKYKPEYMILGQHFTHNEEDGFYAAIANDDIDILTNYVDLCIEGLKTNKFTYLCHPDLINFKGSSEVHDFHMRRLCIAAKELNIPLEFNFLGFREKRHYPDKRFFRIAAEVGNDIVLGCDAHKASSMFVDKTEKEALDYLSEFEIKPISNIDIKFLKW